MLQDQSVFQGLLELVAVLDRRSAARARGERDVARDAQGLRRAALKRIAELERSVFVPAAGTVRREPV